MLTTARSLLCGDGIMATGSGGRPLPSLFPCLLKSCGQLLEAASVAVSQQCATSSARFSGGEAPLNSRTPVGLPRLPPLGRGVQLDRGVRPTTLAHDNKPKPDLVVCRFRNPMRAATLGPAPSACFPATSTKYPPWVLRQHRSGAGARGRV